MRHMRDTCEVYVRYRGPSSREAPAQKKKTGASLLECVRVRVRSRFDWHTGPSWKYGKAYNHFGAGFEGKGACGAL